MDFHFRKKPEQLALMAIGTFAVSVEKHHTLNSCHGVISEPDLLYSTNEEILEHLKSQNVTEVHRITIQRN